MYPQVCCFSWLSFKKKILYWFDSCLLSQVSLPTSRQSLLLASTSWAGLCHCRYSAASNDLCVIYKQKSMTDSSLLGAAEGRYAKYSSSEGFRTYLISALQLRHPAGCHCSFTDAILILLAWCDSKGDRDTGWRICCGSFYGARGQFTCLWLLLAAR